MHGKIMSYEEWMKLTSHPRKPIRSKELKEVDEALKRLEQFGGGDALWRLQQALEVWKRSQGPGDAWKKSVRNKKLAVEKLTAQLAGGNWDSEAVWGRAPQFMHATFDHARLGVLYLLSRMRVRPDIFSVVLEGGLSITGGVLSYYGGKPVDKGLGNVAVDTAQNVFNSVMVPGNAILAAANSAGLDTHASPEQRSLAAKVRQMFDDFIRKIFQLVCEKLGNTEMVYASIKNLGLLCSKIFMETMHYGWTSGATDTFKGLVNLANAAVDKIRVLVMSRHVHIMSGHPAVIVESIKRAMTRSLLHGLYQTLKGLANFGLAWANWFEAMIVGIVIAFFEMLVKTIWRLVELDLLNRTFREAARFWDGRDLPNAFHKQPFAFADWFRRRALNVPAIAILTLNSGICGDKMVYLSMFHEDGSTISKDEFKRGVSLLDHLKVWGASYLDQTGFSFYSTDAFVSALLGHIKSHNQNLSIGEKIWAEVTKFANA